MKDLIEALNIFVKYKNLTYPTCCAHDVLYVVGISYDEVSEDDRKRLEELGFDWSNGTWYSFKYGSA